jgi:hypothetical protein
MRCLSVKILINVTSLYLEFKIIFSYDLFITKLLIINNNHKYNYNILIIVNC